MRIIVYVEGRSDKAAMETLLRPLIEQKRREGATIDFFEAQQGDRKASLLCKAPMKAANIIMNDPHAVVAIVPDLYPKNKTFRHSTVEEMSAGIRVQFEQALRNKKAKMDDRLLMRLHVFCFKHDLEVLLLAAKEALGAYLDIRSFGTTWKDPVEDQDDDCPPKRVVEKLFAENNRHYDPRIDAPLILSQCQYQTIAQRCPQCFKPFVDFLQSIHSEIS